MNRRRKSVVKLPQFSLWKKTAKKHFPYSFDLEITSRCNLDCRHCYINLPAGYRQARGAELDPGEIGRIADQAVALGTLWCLVTGGEPLLRPDFPEIYLLLRRKGLLVSLFTNACLVDGEIVALFRRFPPRNVEVTVYGVTAATYERVTRKPGSFSAFSRGLERLLDAGIPVRLKAMAMRANFQELPAIAAFCRSRTCDYFRFDPLLHLRFDGNPKRNAEILGQRLTPEEIVALEQSDSERSDALARNCDTFFLTGAAHRKCHHLFHCGAGQGSFVVGYDGTLRLCPSLYHPDCVYDLREGALAEAWKSFVPAVRAMTSSSREFLRKCHVCPLINLCLWCPAHAHLEHGRLDAWSEYFCQVAHARAAALHG